MSIYIIRPPTKPAMATPRLMSPQRISPRASIPALGAALSVELAVLEAALPVDVEPSEEPEEAVAAGPSSPPPVELGSTVSSTSAAAFL